MWKYFFFANLDLFGEIKSDDQAHSRLDLEMWEFINEKLAGYAEISNYNL